VKAVVQSAYGSHDVLRIRDVVPPSVGDDAVLVRVHAAAVSISDTITRSGRPLFGRLFTGLRRPRVPIKGSEFAGQIEARGGRVTRFEKGDEVFGSTGSKQGCYAEYVCITEDDLVAIKPSQLSHEEGAAICSALAAWNFLREKADVQPGERVLINGATGGIGTYAVQLARHFGAHVTGACRTADMEFITSLGADEVIDCSREDFMRSGETYDVIFDTENESSYSRCKDSLSPSGIYLRTFPGPAILLQMFWTSLTGRKRAVVSATGLLPIAKRRAFLEEVTNLIRSGALRSVVDRRYPLEQIRDAYRRSESGDTTGTVVVTMGHQRSDPDRDR
jgi:NADPH:quinone reductase-like Zn-dependent oxidoreductase